MRSLDAPHILTIERTRECAREILTALVRTYARSSSGLGARGRDPHAWNRASLGNWPVALGRYPTSAGLTALLRNAIDADPAARADLAAELGTAELLAKLLIGDDDAHLGPAWRTVEGSPSNAPPDIPADPTALSVSGAPATFVRWSARTTPTLRVMRITWYC